jgi:hypothetical protein
MSGEEGFLSRWSRRKRAVAAEPEEAPAPSPPTALPDAPEVPAFDPASLPPLDSLTAASDFTAFLRAEVPAVLRHAALRRAWTLDPAIRDFIGPADYAWDYNAPDGVPGFALELGGDVKRLLAQAIGALEEMAPKDGTPEDGTPEDGTPEDGTPEDGTPEDGPAADSPVLIAQVEPAEAPLVEAPPPEAITTEPPPAKAAASQQPGPPPRRHGGAMPV